ncbi:MAG: response regulator, partial [Desulfococcaceae bacterium]|nr:response regulator [Desulfococcaceae bacterium]
FRFDLELPETGQEAERSPLISRRRIGIRGNAPKILIVDDNKDNRAVFRDLLSPLGFETAEAGNGSEGLKKAEEFQPHALITDLIMPETDGFELIRRIRSHHELRNTVIIAASASVYEEDHRKSTEAGADAFLPKPLEADRLFDLLGRFMGIEWLYEDLPSDREAPAADMVPPGPEILKILLELAEVGDIEEFSDQLERLLRSDPVYAPFADRFRQLLDGFKFNEIISLIKEYLNDESR